MKFRFFGSVLIVLMCWRSLLSHPISVQHQTGNRFKLLIEGGHHAQRRHNGWKTADILAAAGIPLEIEPICLPPGHPFKHRARMALFLGELAAMGPQPPPPPPLTIPRPIIIIPYRNPNKY